MNPTSVLSPEIADLGLAVGLLHKTDGSLAFDSDWFSDPGPRVSKALADEDRRAALVRFVDAVNGDAPTANSGGVRLLKLFDATELGIADAPALVVSLSVDDRNAAYVEVGLSVSFTTDVPRTQTDLVVPLYRTGKMAGSTVQPVAEHFAMAAGSPIRLATSITLGDGTPDVSGFGLRSVDIAVGVPLTGTGPTIELSLIGLVLPGATTPTDIHIGGPDSTIEEALLSLVLGVVQAAARSLGGAGAAALAALDLIGLGPNPDLPPLDVNAIAEHGVSALRDWFATTLAEPARLDAWLQSLHGVVGGTVAGGELRIALGGGPVDLILAVASVPGPGGHLKVTPRVGLELHQLLGAGSSAVRIAARAEVDVMTVDLADGSLTALPAAELFVEAAGDGVRLLPAGPVQIGSAHIGVALHSGSVVPMIRLLDVHAGGSTHPVVDLSSADAVIAAVGNVAEGVLGDALDGFPAGVHLKALLGLVETGGSGKIDAGQLLVDPLGALSGWWHSLVTTHSADVPAVLGHLRDLIAVDAFVDIGGHAALAVSGDGTPEHPWSIPVIDRVTIEVWHVDDVLTVAVDLGFRVDDLAGGCTVVEADARAELVTIDFALGHASLLHAVQLGASLRGRGVPQTRLDLGPVAVVVDSIGVLGRWTAADGFVVGLATPGLAAEVDGLSVPLALPIGADWTTSVFADVENFIGLLGASQPHGWLRTLTDLLGWTIGGRVAPHRLSLTAWSANAPTELRAWAEGVIASGEVIDALAPRLATLLTGSNDGIGGAISGRGTPDNPWVLPLSGAENGFAIELSLGPSGPKLSPTLVSNALSSWRPGDPGLTAAGLAGAMLAESAAGADVAALMHGRRSTLAGGWADLVARVTATDVLVAPPLTPPTGVEVISHPGRNFRHWSAVGVTEAFGGPAPVDAAVVRVAIGSVTDNPWKDQPADRQIDLSAPGLAPESFTVNSPSAGEWFVVLGTRGVTSLGVTDPTGVLGQAARLSRVVAALGAGRPVVIVAVGGAGHAARLAAHVQPSVTHLITLGTPWGPVAFDSARNGSSADGLRLLTALIPPFDTTDPDDADLGLGRAIVEGLGDAAGQVDIEAPRPTLAVRAGLRVRAWFGSLDQLTVERAFTAIVAAGLSLRARRRADAALTPPTSAQLSVRVPLSAALPSSGHGVVVDGYVNVGLIGSDFATAGVGVANRVALHLTVSDTDTWLLGGPGTVPGGGADPLELRFFDVDIDIGLGGNAAASASSITLHEVSALGAYSDRIVVSPPALGTTTGTTETLPFLPEARAAIAALIVQLRSIEPTAPGAHLLALLDGIGLSTSTGLVPDALTHLLHDPASFVSAALSSSSGRASIATALSRLVDSAAVAGDVVTITRSGATVAVDLGNRSASLHASGSGALPWAIDLAGLGHGTPTGAVTLGSAAFNGGAVRFGLAPFTVSFERLTATGAVRSAAVWPSPDTDAIAAFALAGIPAEAIRLVLTAVRTLDADVATGIDALTDAIGVLGSANADGIRPILAPIGLFDDPGGWFRHHVLANGSALDVDRVIDLFEALKPFVGLGGTPRGHWPIVGGVELSVTAGGSGPTVAVALDPSVWLTNGSRPPVAMGASVGLTLTTNGAPTPAVEVFAGVPTDPPTVDHRSAVHVIVDAGGLRVFLRSSTGADIGLYPNAAGLGQLLSTGVTNLLLPLVLNELAALSGSPARTQIAALTAAVGRGLDVLEKPVATPPKFSGSQLGLLANDPATWLDDHIGTLVTNAVAALDPLIHQLPGAPTAVLDGANLVVTVRTVSLTFNPTPLTVSIAGSVTGIPIIGGAAASFAANASGVTAFDFGVGPATFDLGGPKLRPLLRVGRAEGQGWEAAIGLALDDIAPTTAGHKELFARWREADGLAMVARTRGASTNTDATDAPTVALFAADSIVELLGNYIIEITEVSALLDKTVNGQSVRIILQGSILSDADSHKLRTAPISSLPGSLFVLARKLASALPPLPLGPLSLSLAETRPNVYGVRLDVIDHDKGLELNQGGDIAISLVTDASWIEPPVPPPPQPGIVVDIVSISSDPTPVFAPSPGIAANGVGVRIAKRSGPLLDAGLRLDSVAVHLFGSLQPGTGSVDVSGGVHLALEGLGVPLGAGGGDNSVAKGVMADAGGSGGPPTPKFSPAIAVQAHHGVNGVAVSLRAGPGDGPWYLPIQRAFGPLYLEQVGLGTGYLATTPRQLDFIAVSLDGSVSLFGITATVDKLRLTYHVNRPFFDVNSWAVDLDGFAISANMGGLTLVGALLKAPLSPPLVGMEYLGMLKIGFNGYGIDLFGGYANPTDGQGNFASFFAFGALHAPLGGVPAFFITGIGIGFGINRELKPPTMDTITSNPFLAAMKALGPPPSPKAQLDQMRANIAPKRGEYWVAAGISFTSFVLISGEIVVTVAFGDGLEITVLGMARVELPVPGAALVSIELALLARFSTKEGTLLVQAQLTENSWLLMPAVRLTGGFAMATWWKGDNAGQFVVTMGGYHPKFHHPGYPTVPRLGIRWQPIENISVIGETYFALCSEALMAGTKFEVSAHFGPAHAKLSFGADGIVFFDPFWFDVSAWAEISAGIRIWVLFGTIDVELSLGAYIEVTGPPIHLEGHFDICGFEVPFEIGDEGNPADRALNAADFRDKYLRASSDAQVIQSSLVRGSVAAGRSSDGSQQKVPDGTAANPYRVVPEFELMLITTAPAVDMALTHAANAPKSLHSSAPELGVAPMYSHDLSSHFHAELTKPGSLPNEISLNKVTVAARPPAAFPKGVWGQAQNPKAKKVPAGETVDAADGFAMSTVLGDLVGAPPIDYHQVEIPLNGKKGRKPLPFVTNTVNTNARVTATGALKTLANAVRPDDGDLDERFNVAAKVLEAGGYGALGVASMRGDRAAPPRFGSLADDLVKAPAVVSSKIKGQVVPPRDRTKPFVAPMVKAVLGAPLTIATSAMIRTTVKDAGRAITRPVPTIDAMRADAISTGPASLITQSRLAPTTDKRTVLAGGTPPATRLATSPSAAVANARPDRAAVGRINAMTEALPNGATIHEGEVAVVTVASRPTGDRLDSLSVQGGPTRVIALASGGNVLFDDIVAGDAGTDPVEIPAKTERVVIAAPGDLTNVGGSLDGWYAGQSLPLVGWDLALAAGAVVRFANNRVADHRERADGGWADTRDLARASQITTRFDRPVRSVAVAIDDAALAGQPDAASRVVVRLRGAERAVDAAGGVVAPRILVSGIRTILVFDVEPQPLPLPEDRDPNVAVIVENTRQGDLAGVAATTGDSDELLRTIATAGFDAAIAAPLPGGLGERILRWQAAAAPTGAPKRAVKKAPAKKKSQAKKTTARKRG